MSKAGTKGDKALRELKYFLIVFLLFLGSGATQSYVAPYVKSLGFSSLQGTAVVAAIYFAQIPARFLAIYLANALGLKASLILGILGYVIYPLAFAASRAYWQLVLVMVFWGFTSGVFWTSAGVAVLNESARSRYGKASGALFAGSGVGMALGVLLLDQLVAREGSRAMFILSALPPALALAIGFAVSAGGRLESKSTWEATREGVVRAFREREVSFVALLLFVSALSYGIVYGGLGLLIARNVGMAYIGRLTVSFFILKGIFSRVGGSIGDAIGRRMSFILSFISASIASFILATSPGKLGLVVAGALLGYQVSTVSVNANAWVGDAAKQEHRAGFTGVIQAANALGVCVALLAGGYLLSSIQGSRILFFAFALINSLAVILAVAMPEKRRARLGMGSAMAKRP
ncbi:MAG: MFS transporter [Firmicutes bacterium]|nr:MFS transporter [Bacillota bacterium]